MRLWLAKAKGTENRIPLCVDDGACMSVCVCERDREREGVHVCVSLCEWVSVMYQ